MVAMAFPPQSVSVASMDCRSKSGNAEMEFVDR